MARRKYNGRNGMTAKNKKWAMMVGALALGVFAPRILPADWYAKLATTIGLEVS